MPRPVPTHLCALVCAHAGLCPDLSPRSPVPSPVPYILQIQSISSNFMFYSYYCWRATGYILSGAPAQAEQKNFVILIAIPSIVDNGRLSAAMKVGGEEGGANIVCLLLLHHFLLVLLFLLLVLLLLLRYLLLSYRPCLLPYCATRAVGPRDRLPRHLRILLDKNVKSAGLRRDGSSSPRSFLFSMPSGGMYTTIVLGLGERQRNK